MSRKLNFSIMRHMPEMVDSLQAILANYGTQHYTEIDLQEIDYDTGWLDFVRIAIHGSNLDVSEMGTTWINDFSEMNALRPFTTAEVKGMGGAQNFVPALWSTFTSTQGMVRAIPWMTDVSFVFYRRDLLAKAGVNETTAFGTHDQIQHTLDQLQSAGVHHPWVVPTSRSYITLHNLAMWLWREGLDFIDLQGKQVTLNEPKARTAIHNYLDLYRYIAPTAYHLGERESDNWFIIGEAAVTIGGPWMVLECERTPEVIANLGVAIPMGCSYIGGSGLVRWRASNRDREASELISHMVSQEVQLSLPRPTGLLPARLDMLEKYPFSPHDASLNRVVKQALQSGRSFPNVQLWGTIEDRLVNAFAAIWAELLASPNPDIDILLDKYLVPAVRRLNLLLADN